MTRKYVTHFFTYIFAFVNKVYCWLVVNLFQYKVHQIRVSAQKWEVDEMSQCYGMMFVILKAKYIIVHSCIINNCNWKVNHPIDLKSVLISELYICWFMQHFSLIIQLWCRKSELGNIVFLSNIFLLYNLLRLYSLHHIRNHGHL